jgi:CubicO group peptidase (beta-lactamase class C family)
MTKVLKLMSWAVLLLLGQHLWGQAYSPAQIDSLVKSSMDQMPQAGIAVAVIQDGEVVHAKGYGITALSTGEKVNADTRFAIASNSKSFTTMALGLLVDEGKLNWEDKVVDHIPEFKMYNPYLTANFNIVDLLTHRSGLGLGAGDLMFFPDGADFTVADVLNSFQYQKPVSAFRTQYDYDNLLYVVAGEVVARVSGMPWDEFVETRIMQPLGMDQSVGIYQNLSAKTNVAMPHSSAQGKLRELETYVKADGSLGAAGGIYSSVNDLSKWLIMHLDEGKFGADLSQTLVSKANHDYMWRPHTNMGFRAVTASPYQWHFRVYGLGWNIYDLNGYIVLEHTGGLPGMLSRTIVIPELKAGIVVLTNASPGGYGYRTISQSILEAMLDLEKRDIIALAKKGLQMREAKGDSVVSAVWEKAASANSDHLNLDDYMGLYRDNWFGEVEIGMKAGKLWFTSRRSPKLNGQMFYYQANTFAVKWEYDQEECNAFAMFSLDENGQAIGIKMKGISPNIDFSFDFHDLDLRRVD